MTADCGMLSEALAREPELVEIGTRIQTQVQSEMDKSQREGSCASSSRPSRRSSARARGDEAQELAASSTEAGSPSTPGKKAEREIRASSQPPAAGAEHGVIRTYLEWLATLPWSKAFEDNLDLDHARRRARPDHYDLDKVKERILEYLAVRKLKRDRAGRSSASSAAGRRQDLPRRSIARATGGSSCASRSAACATRPRSAATAARTSARCPGRSARASEQADAQPGLRARRDRQDRRGLPRRPGGGAARGARPRAELDLQRPLPELPYDLSRVRSSPPRTCWRPIPPACATAWR